MRIWSKRRVGQVHVRGVADDEGALARAARVVDVAGVEVDAHVVARLEEVGEGAGPAAEVERAQPMAEVQSRRMVRADGFEVVLEDAAQEDEEDGVIRDAFCDRSGGEETRFTRSSGPGSGPCARP